MEALITKTIENFQKNNMAGYFVDNRQELFTLLAKLIPKNTSVGSGDSATLDQTGVFDFLRSNDYRFLDKHREDLTSEDKRGIYIQNFSADTFITGANAITADGKIFNIDGNGSRVAPMLYGPEQVIVVVGKNKIVENVDKAIQRARQIAAVLDARRLNKATPCVTTGRCVDCRHEQRICNDFVLITRQFVKGRIKVIIVNETLGY